MRTPRIAAALAPESRLQTREGEVARREFLAAESDFVRGDADGALRRLRAALGTHKKLLSQHDHVVLWVELARYALALGSAEGVQKLEELAKKIGSDNPLLAAGILMNAGRLLAEAERYGDGEPTFEIAAQTFLAAGDLRSAANALRELGHIALFAEHPLRALVAWRSAVTIAQVERDTRSVTEPTGAIVMKLAEAARELAALSTEEVAGELLEHARVLEAATGDSSPDERTAEKKALN